MEPPISRAWYLEEAPCKASPKSFICMIDQASPRSRLNQSVICQLPFNPTTVDQSTRPALVFLRYSERVMPRLGMSINRSFAPKRDCGKG